MDAYNAVKVEHPVDDRLMANIPTTNTIPGRRCHSPAGVMGNSEGGVHQNIGGGRIVDQETHYAADTRWQFL